MSSFPHSNTGTSIPTSVLEDRHKTIFRRSHQHSSLPQLQTAEQQMNISFNNTSNHNPFIPSPLVSQHHHSRREHQQQNQHHNVNFMPDISPVSNMMNGMNIVGDPSQLSHLQKMHVHRHGQNHLEKNYRQGAVVSSSSASSLLTSPIKRKSRNNTPKIQITNKDVQDINLNSMNAIIECHPFPPSNTQYSANINAGSTKKKCLDTARERKNQSVVTPSSLISKYEKKRVYKISENDVISGPKFRRAIRKQKGNKLFCQLVTDCGGKLVQIEIDDLAKNEEAAPVYVKEATVYIKNQIKDTQPPGRFLKFECMQSFEGLKNEIHREAREDYGEEPAYLDAKSFSVYHNNNKEIPVFTELSMAESSKKIGAAIRDKRNQLRKNERSGIEPIETKTKLRDRKSSKVEKDFSLQPQSQPQPQPILPTHGRLMSSNLTAGNNNESPLFSISSVERYRLKDEFDIQQPLATPVPSPFSHAQSTTSADNSTFSFSSPSLFNSKSSNEVFSYSPLYNDHQTKHAENGIEETNEFCQELNLSSILKQQAQKGGDNVGTLKQKQIRNTAFSSIKPEKNNNSQKDNPKKLSICVGQRSKKRKKNDAVFVDPSHHRLYEKLFQRFAAAKNQKKIEPTTFAKKLEKFIGDQILNEIKNNKDSLGLNDSTPLLHLEQEMLRLRKDIREAKREYMNYCKQENIPSKTNKSQEKKQ